MRKFEIVKDDKRKIKGTDIQLPTRADDGSAGYDIYSPFDFEINPKDTIVFPTDVKVCMEKDEVLFVFIRSSIGIKRRISITNGTGVIDSTYYGNEDNDGNIHLALTNEGNKVQSFKRGERIAQGVFVKYLTTDNDKPLSHKRTGGIGSSGV